VSNERGSGRIWKKSAKSYLFRGEPHLATVLQRYRTFPLERLTGNLMLTRLKRAHTPARRVSRVESVVARGDARKTPHASTAERRDAPPPLRPRESDGIVSRCLCAASPPFSHALRRSSRIAPLTRTLSESLREIYRPEDISDIIQGHLHQTRIKRIHTVFVRTGSFRVAIDFR